MVSTKPPVAVPVQNKPQRGDVPYMYASVTSEQESAKDSEAPLSMDTPCPVSRPFGRRARQAGLSSGQLADLCRPDDDARPAERGRTEDDDGTDAAPSIDPSPEAVIAYPTSRPLGRRARQAGLSSGQLAELCHTEAALKVGESGVPPIASAEPPVAVPVSRPLARRHRQAGMSEGMLQDLLGQTPDEADAPPDASPSPPERTPASGAGGAAVAGRLGWVSLVGAGLVGVALSVAWARRRAATA